MAGLRLKVGLKVKSQNTTGMARSCVAASSPYYVSLYHVMPPIHASASAPGLGSTGVLKDMGNGSPLASRHSLYKVQGSSGMKGSGPYFACALLCPFGDMWG